MSQNSDEEGGEKEVENSMMKGGRQGINRAGEGVEQGRREEKYMIRKQNCFYHLVYY